jgi:hypothetical protein
VVIGGLLRAIPGQKVDPQMQTIEPPKADEAKPTESKASSK